MIVLLNQIKQRAAQGQPSLGTFYELGGTAAVECVGIGGMDFVVVDTEHGPFEAESAMLAVMAAERRGCTPFVRARDLSRPAILKLLDVGAMGVIVPDVHTVEEVKQLVEYAKYYPLGHRGYAPTLASAYGFADYAKNVDELFSTSNRETLLIPQCETKEALEHIEEIVSVDGVDGIFVGPYDLSVALGKPAQLEDPELLAAIAHVLDVCKRHGKLTMIFSGSPENTARCLKQGFDCVACGMDSMFLIQAIQTYVADVKKRLED